MRKKFLLCKLLCCCANFCARGVSSCAWGLGSVCARTCAQLRGNSVHDSGNFPNQRSAVRQNEIWKFAVKEIETPD
uniref:Secreted protein n=1 Tax=Chelydra serpentina TaxID=8475 RepID=A0A8C3RVS9_CHESE